MVSHGVLTMQYQQTGLENESEFLYHEPCGNCGSSDANSRYSDGHAYCFVCHHYEPGDDDREFHHHNSAPTIMLKGTPVALKKRRLPEEACRKYRIHKDGDTLRMHYFDKAGNVVAA